MKTISRPTAHKQLTTNHTSMQWYSQEARISIRKDGGEYRVLLEDFVTRKITKTNYKTLAGALVAADALRSYYL